MTAVKDGMVVRSDTDKVKKAVQGDLEFLLRNHPVDCPICDQAGECYLQDFYMQVGLHDSRVPLPDKVRKRKVVDLGPRIVLDSERCVLCSRCIRFSDEVSKTSQFGFFNRGSHMEIGTFRDRPLEDAYAGCYADVCPVGALTSKDFRFSSRVWFLSRSASVCPECSTGCNVRVDHKDGAVHRALPRRNPDVNQSWMCDIGRLSFVEAKATRLLAPLLRSGAGPAAAVPLERALAEVTARLGEARGKNAAGIALLATPRATCEELWLFRRLGREVLGTPHLDYRVDPRSADVREREDQVLRRKDPNPNTRGAALLDVLPGKGGMAVKEALEAAAAGRLTALVLLGPEVLGRYPDPAAVRRALQAVPFSVLLDSHQRQEHELFTVVLPAATFVEDEGTFVNFADRIQRLERAFPPPGEARARVALLERIIAGLDGGEPAPGGARALLKAIAAAVPAFAGLGYERVGPLGKELNGAAAGPA
jgi:NADH-quinone oxidoreductase subunit G